MKAQHRRSSQEHLAPLKTTSSSPPPVLSGAALSTTLSAIIEQKDAALLEQDSLQPPPVAPYRQNHSPSTPTSAGLRLQTSNLPNCTVTSAPTIVSSRPNTTTTATTTAAMAGVSHSASFADSLSPASASSSHSYSPAMDCLAKMTPLPSPIVTSDSPGPWNKFRSKSLSRPTPPRSINGGDSVIVTSSGESLSIALAAQSQRRVYQGLAPGGPGAGHEAQRYFSNSNSASRSGSDYEITSITVPFAHGRDIFKPTFNNNNSSGGIDDKAIGTATLDTGAVTTTTTANETRIRREEFLAQRRRALSSVESSPALSGSVTSASSISSVDTAVDATDSSNRLIKKQKLESFEAKTVITNKVKRWRGIRLLGQGTFSKVILATSEELPEEVDEIDDEGVVVEREPVALNPRKLAAVKIVEHGAAGGASRERVESSLKRELDILKSVHHPCLIRLKACSIERHRALLVLPYCPGGDLFDVAVDFNFSLDAPLIQRMFAEIVSAVRYLHKNGIVHRDVKLENVLINFTRPQLSVIATSPNDYPHPITTLTDVGLSRRVDFEKDDLLVTRCGSDDYAAPELIMGQPYDGRQTDAWALGVLLFSLMEGRLPFDPPPGSTEQKMRSKTAHKIARCEWKWNRLAPRPKKQQGTLEIDLGEGDEVGYDKGFEGGKRIVEGLLKRAGKRMKLEAVEEDEWVKEGIKVEIKEVEEL